MDKYSKLLNDLEQCSHNWLITGVSGFIGSNLLERLLLSNQNVIGSALGIIATGCFLAIEGFSGSGISYDLYGWFKY